MLSILEKKLHICGLHSQVEMKVQDGHTLVDIADNSIDVIFSNFGITLLPDCMKAWNTALRVMKTNGVLTATSWSNDSFHTKLLKSILDINSSPAQSCEHLDGFKNELLDAGFRTVKIYKTVHEMVFPSGADLITAMLSNPVVKLGARLA
jgi:SAM-dependent methyltransferase